MKNFIKRIACTVLALAALMLCSISAFADTVKVTSDIDAIKGVVYIETHSGSNGVRGTGFAIGDPNKQVEYIVTNAHVVTGNGSWSARNVSPMIYFSYATNDFMRASVYKIDEDKDIAVLKLPEPTNKRTSLVLCPDSDVTLGEDATAIGYPADADKASSDHKYDLTDVKVAGCKVAKKVPNSHYNNGLVYDIDGHISGGNSGGPLVNKKGQVIGINTYGNTQTELNYAVSSDELIKLISGNKAEIGYVLSTELTSGIPNEKDNSDNKSKPASGDSNKPGSSAAAVIIIIAAVVVVAAAGVITFMMTKKNSNHKPKAAPAPAAVQVSAPAQSAGAMLICEKGLLAGRTFPIGNGAVIGRNTQKCGVCFPVDAKGVSGVHCELRKTANGYEIVDLGSSYGTTLGSGQKLTPNVPVYIPNGTYFMVGGPEQLFQIKY